MSISISFILFSLVALLVYLAMAVALTLVVYVVIRRTRGLGGQDTAEILALLKETNRLLE